ncbi:M56 family metallopeptidase [Wenyingzhuangia marina]|uniref:Signal transducer regulating beta-lactamase production, contains metallopeptidase domain n=1 Tax=Wenyingzhuangia marina TaxID=1195760 RepID=A0A1M5W5N8_9FLAO|nr:M56 family metallopeptidase [Wenyingzhuangia marina]GGF75676.1 hypothetical protein GCM10011397_18300 [Wenyingzhuangia marina]SHH82761.1 Signal transducer regulating beta-lactamase production, contains metallopeptidase domain [Wenyingzhuangia marina]
MEYLLKVSAVIVVFYLVYKTLLQKITFFEANRWFLILGIFISFLFPLIVIPVYHEYTTEVVSNVQFHELSMLAETSIEESFDVLDYLLMIYVLGITIFSLRFFFRLISLARVINKNETHKKEEGFIFIETTTELSPFSFFKWIVYNPTQFNQKELGQIITHEKVHAKQYHSVDILLMEICCVFLWFHPFVWLYNKSLKQNLEFLADKYALNQFNDTKSYQYTMLKASIPSYQMALSNHFYNSLIKKRIAMLQKSKSKKINLLKYALVVPVLTLFLMSFNTKDVYVEKVIKREGNFLKNSIEKFENVEKAMITQDSTRLRVRALDFKGTPLFFVDGKEIPQKEFEKINPSDIYSISVLKDKHATDKYGKKGKDGVVEITMKKNNDSTTQVSKSYPDIKVVSNEDGAKTESFGIRQHTIEVDAKDLNSTKYPLYIIDGKEVSDDEFKKINPDDIQSINVLKDKHATDKYGEKAKDGVVEITMKKENEFIMVLRKNTSDDQLKKYRKIYKEKFKCDLVFEVIRNSKNEITFYDIQYSFDGKRTSTDKSRDDETPINPIFIKYDANTKSLSTKSL